MTLGFNLAAVLMRNLRASLIEVLTAEYVDFARAKGLRNRVVLSKHVLRNALISTVTLLGLNSAPCLVARSSPRLSLPFRAWGASWWTPSMGAIMQSSRH